MQIRHTDVDPVVAGASIDGDEVRVFLSTPDLLGDATRLERVLSDADRSHIERFRFDVDRRAARTSRILQRLALSQCSSVAPTSWEFTAEPLHKPRICGPEFAPPLEFSVSNTRGLAACAVTIGRRVGIDVEAYRPQVPTSVLQRCWSSRERAIFEPLTAAERSKRFAAVWTAKESFAKAIGLGLALDLALVEIDADATGYRLVLDAGIGENGVTWTLAHWQADPSHALSVCVEGESERCVVTSRWLRASTVEGL